MQPDSFKLTVELGNDAMQDSADLANALRALAAKLQFGSGFMTGESGRVRDDNGNTVGSWSFS